MKEAEFKAYYQSQIWQVCWEWTNTAEQAIILDRYNKYNTEMSDNAA